MFFRKSINLLQSPFSEIVKAATPNRIETQSTIRIRFDAERARLRGWYRLKLKTPNTIMNRLCVRGDQLKGPMERACDAHIRANHVGGYLFVKRDVKYLELEIEFTRSGEIDFSATLRPISRIEQVWLAIRSAAPKTPHSLLQLFRPNLPIHFDFQFGGIHDRRSELAYRRWIQKKEKRAVRIVRERLMVTKSQAPPISIILPVCDPSPNYLLETLESVKHQTRPDWQLCIADDASKSAEVHQIIREATRDGRINATFREMRGNISAATNSAFSLARHPFVFCLDHDDVLAPQAVELLSQFVAVHPETELLYTDEDVIDANGQRRIPRFKPDYSPDLLRSHNYVNHISMFRTDSVKAVSGWRTPFDGAQDYDMVLRIIERVPAPRIRHLPLVLYHWRAIPGSTASNLNYKSWASEAGRAALQDHIRRSGNSADVRILQGTLYRVAYALPELTPKVSIIIPFRDKSELLSKCIESIFERTVYSNYDIVIVDNGSIEQKTLALLDELRKDDRIKVLTDAGPFNFSALNNRAVAATDAEFICFLNSDTRIITVGWLSELVSRACQSWVGCVGPRLLYEDGTIQHAGIILGLKGAANHAFAHEPRNASGDLDRLRVACNYSAITAACLVVRRALFLKVGGFDETELSIVFNDVDLCLKLKSLGLYNVYTPFAELHHYESSFRGADDSSPERQNRLIQQERAFVRRYDGQLLQDPFYSPHYSLTEGFSIDGDERLEDRIKSF